MAGAAKVLVGDTVLAKLVQDGHGLRTFWVAFAAAGAAALVGAVANFLFNRKLESSRRKAEAASRLFVAKHEAYKACAGAAQALGDVALDLHNTLQQVKTIDDMHRWLSDQMAGFRARDLPNDHPAVLLYAHLRDQNRWTALSEPMRAKADELQNLWGQLQKEFDRSELAFPDFRPAIDALDTEILRLWNQATNLSQLLLEPSEEGTIHSRRDEVLKRSNDLGTLAVDVSAWSTDLLTELQSEIFGALVGHKLPFRKRAPECRVLTREGFRPATDVDAVNEKWRDDAERYKQVLSE